MKPKITYQCTNEECAEYGKEIVLHYSFFFGSNMEERGEDYWTARIKHCRSCYRTGKVCIEHGSRTFSNIEAFEEYVLGVAKEAKLLKKIVDSKVQSKLFLRLSGCRLYWCSVPAWPVLWRVWFSEWWPQHRQLESVCFRL